MVLAQIQFTQNLVTPGPGVAMIGTPGPAPVTISNADNTGVVKWTYRILDAPIDSAITPSTLSSGTTPTAQFIPDAPPNEHPGSFRVELTVLGADGSKSTDIRNFIVLTTRGWVLPSFKSAAQELNYGSNTEGWEDSLNRIFLDIDANLSGGLVLNGDVTGPSGANIVEGIQTTPVDPAPPALNDVLFFDGINWVPKQLTQDEILPAFTTTLTIVGGSLREIGQNVITPAFTATYSAAPDQVILTDTEANPPKDVTLPDPTSFSSDWNFLKSVYGQTVTFTTTSTKGAIVKQANAVMSWVQKVYWGASSQIAGYNSAFILGLSGSALQFGRARTNMSINASGIGVYAYYCFRDAFGDAGLQFLVNGFNGGFLLADTISFTNASGVAELYRIYRSEQPNLGPFLLTVT